MSPVARVRAQAKVNLFLRILAREASGYHALETLFARLALADEIAVRPTSGARSIECRGADAGPAEANLAWRAAAAFATATGWPAGFEIQIDKRIPIGGGLGGGSADAGAVLRALNALAPSRLPLDRLLAIAAILGADVPFMTMESPLALAWARGDRLLALPPLPSLPVSLIVHPFGVSSAAAFGWVAEGRGAAMPGAPRLLDLDDLASWERLAALAGNDFERDVAGRHPPIAASLASARAAGARIAEISGSGATVFAIAPDGAALRLAGLPPGASIVETRTAVSVEDVVVTR